MNQTVSAPGPSTAVAPPRSSGRAQSLEHLWGQCVQALGTQALLCAPMLTMGRELFPDRWKEDLESARSIIVRALAYMGVELRDVSLLAVDAESPEQPPRLGHNQPLSAWFVGWDQGIPTIAVGVELLNKPGLMIPALIRSSIHAFLVHRGKLQSKQHDSALVDLMGMTLGWGIVLTHASHVIMQSSGKAKYTQLTQLPPAAMATSLAWVALARRLEPKSVKEIGKSLAPNQRDAFERAYKATKSGEISMPPALLELPPPQEWPPVWDLQARVASAQASLKALPVMDKAAKEIRPEQGIVGKNKGKAVFMVRRPLSMRIMKFGVGAVFATSMLLRADPSSEVDTAQLMLIGAGLVLLGGIVGRFFHEQRCSDAKCDARLSASDTVCPRCGGTISGVISNPKERLAAEEKLLESQEGA